MSTPNKKVTIIGGGIAGLSAAHELAERGFHVTIYEANDDIGGLARSKRSAQDNGIPTEISWRGYGPYYKNVFEMMSKIPLAGKQNTVYSNLSRPIKFITPLNTIHPGTPDTVRAIDMSTFNDRRTLMWTFIKHLTASEARNKEYAKINAADYLKPKLTAPTYEFVTSLIGPWIGIDPQRASLFHVGNFFKFCAFSGNPMYHEADLDGPGWRHGTCGDCRDSSQYCKNCSDRWLVLNQPTSEGWFDHWKEYLQEMGVVINLNHKAIQLKSEDSNITDIEIINTNTDEQITVESDYYILATNPFAAARIVEDSGLSHLPQLSLLSPLTSEGPQLQLAFFIAFEDEIKMPESQLGITIQDSPFNLTLYSQDDLWASKMKPQVSLGDGVKSLWSGTACISYIPGILYDKPFSKLTKEEFFDEIIAQIKASEEFMALISDANGADFGDFKILTMTTWDTWVFPKDADETLYTAEDPKWVTTTKTAQYTPTTSTELHNLFLAGTHVKTTASFSSMEAACESGRIAANSIVERFSDKVDVNNHKLPGWMTSLQAIDGVLYKLRLPNVSDVIAFVLTGIIIFILYILVIKILKRM